MSEGWGFPGRSRKAHFFRDTQSLCRKWGFYRGPLEPDLPSGPSPDECKPCSKIRLAERAASPAEEPS